MKAETDKKNARYGFWAGRKLEFVVSLLAFIVIVVSLLRVPMSADAYDDRITPMMVAIFSALGAATIIIVRDVVLKMAKASKIEEEAKQSKTPVKVDLPPIRILFYWILLGATFVVMMPWLFNGVLSDDDVSVIGSMFLVLLMLATAPLLAVLAAAFVLFPIEATIRGFIQLIKTRGQNPVLFILGMIGFVILAIIACGFFAVDTFHSGPGGQGAIVAALLGIPGAYYVKSAALLWTTRILMVTLVLSLLYIRLAARKTPLSSDDAS